MNSTTPAQSDNKDDPGKLIQYRRHANGFVPTPETLKELPPGIYKTTFVMDVLCFIPHPIHTDNLLRLPDSSSDEIIDEIEKFWTLKENFKRLGVLHKRGFLLHGPPGSGKTSTISFVCKETVKNGGVVFLLTSEMRPGFFATLVSQFRGVEPDRPCVVVMEDLDTIIHTHGESEVLSMLDGEYTIDGAIYLATTNYPEDLDGRITNRPSRFDKVMEIGTPNFDSRKLYIESRNTGFSKEEIEEIADCTEGFSISHIKELLIGMICFQKPMETELERLRGMEKKPSSEKSSNRKPAGFAMEAPKAGALARRLRIGNE